MQKIIFVLVCLAWSGYGRRTNGRSGRLTTKHKTRFGDLATLLFARYPVVSRNGAVAHRKHVDVSRSIMHAVPRRPARGNRLVMESVESSDQRETRGDEKPIRQRIGEGSRGVISTLAEKFLGGRKRADETTQDERVSVVIRRMKADVNLLDTFAEKTPQRTQTEKALLGSTAVGSFVAPFLLPHLLVEYLVPALSFLPLAVASHAEYKGKMAAARGREIAAVTLQAAAEAEELLSQAEREKAIIGLCVGISATAAALALVWPDYIDLFGSSSSGLTLLPPLVAGLFAAVSSLASQVTTILARRAVGVGARRFASSEDVRKTWLSAPQQIEKATMRARDKWTYFFVSCLPAPLIALAFPGDISSKAVVCSAIAAAQAALGLAVAEQELTMATESVAEKSRSAAVSETYSKQAIRAGATLPYTSAIAGLCAAITVGAVEALPIVPTVFGEAILAALFPTAGALSASSASSTKSCCEIDATAAGFAATTLADTEPRNPIEQSSKYVRRSVRRSIETLKSYFNSMSGEGAPEKRKANSVGGVSEKWKAKQIDQAEKDRGSSVQRSD